MEILSIEDLSFSYDISENSQTVLKDISLKISEGDFILLCGPSGGGKSTLLRLIKSSLSPCGARKGNIKTNIPDEKIGYVFQQPDSQLVMEKVFDELIFGCENLGLKTEEINQRLSEITAFLGIEDLTDKECALLSGGQKQLINLASVMMMEPDIIIFDEPLSQLDPISSVFFMNMIKRLHDELGLTVIICAHELSEILPCASKIWFLNNSSVSEFFSADSFTEYIVKHEKEYICMLPPLIRAAVSFDSFNNSYPYSVADFKKLNIPNAFIDDYIKKSSVNQCLNKTERRIIKDKSIPDEKKPILGKNLYFKYDKNDRDILKGLNINIPNNSFYAIIGGNGSGKSTLMSLMTGYKAPYKGGFKGLLGDDFKLLSTAYLPQNPLYLFTGGCLYDDYLSTMYKFHVSDKDRKHFVYLLENNPLFMPLCDLLAHNAKDLSGGELQAAAILLLHVLKRPVLLLDEPTKGMDALYKKHLSGYLKELLGNGVTVIMISHDLEFVSENATHCGVMYDGKIIAEGLCHDILRNNRFFTTALFRGRKRDF